MLFSRVASFFIFSMTLGGVVLGTPVVQKRDLADVQQVVTDLKSTTDAVVPQIQDLVTSKSATSATVFPLVDQLTDAFNNAAAALKNVSANAGSTKRQSASLQEIAQITSDVLTAELTAISNLVKSSGGNIPSLSPKVNALMTSTSSFLSILDSSSSGLSGLLGGLLGTLLPLVLSLLGGLGGGAGLGSLLSLVLGLLSL